LTVVGAAWLTLQWHLSTGCAMSLFRLASRSGHAFDQQMSARDALGKRAMVPNVSVVQVHDGWMLSGCMPAQCGFVACWQNAAERLAHTHDTCFYRKQTAF